MQSKPASAARAPAVVAAVAVIVIVMVIGIVADAGGPVLAASAAGRPVPGRTYPDPAGRSDPVGPGDPAGPGHPAGPAAPGKVTYRPPIDAPVLDPFRAPLTRYGPGNRGIDYATVAGTPVLVAADGVVVFAGPVAGGLHVTVLHGDGIRTTYSYLALIRVRRGQVVRGGEAVGLAAAMLHVGARRGDTYIDPASLWGRSVEPPAVHLVPLDGDPPGVEALRAPQPLRLVHPTVAALAGLGGAAPHGAAAGVGARGG